MQRSLFFALLLLIAVGLAADALFRHEWERAADALGIKHWLQAHLSLPAPATLRTVLAASAAGTATVLGLVLSISLIVWQTTADRYRSSMIVAFLLRERLSAVFVRLLGLAFAYSLWVLVLLEITGSTAYVSSAIALSLSTVAVLSLISYRELGLLGYLPQNIGRRLGEEIVREIARAQRKNAGPSVENHSRRIVAADLQIFEDLLRRLRSDGEALDIVACLSQLNSLLSGYLQLKQRFSPKSRFFPTQKRRLGPYGYAIEEAVGARGQMTPTADESDHLWFERRLLEVVHVAETGALLKNEAVALALTELWSTALQHAWYREEPDALELLLGEVTKTAVDPGFRATPSVAEQSASIPWVMVEAAGVGFLTSAAAIVQGEPWRGDEHSALLPWKAQEDARDLAQRIRLEIAVTGAVVTPETEMVREISVRRGSRLAEAQRSMIKQAISLVRSQLRASVADNPSSAPVIAQMTLRTVLRIVHHELELPDLTDLTTELYGAAELADESQIRDLHTDAGRAARVLAERNRWPEAYELLRASEAITYLAKIRATDPTVRVSLFYDGLFTAALVHGWAEYHQHPGHVEQVGQYLEPPYADLDLLSAAVANHQLFTGMLFTIGIAVPNVVHFQWAQSLLQAAGELPEVPVDDGGFGYGSRRNHPSTLFRKVGLLALGPGDCLEHLIEATLAARGRARQEFVDVLEAVIKEREVV